MIVTKSKKFKVLVCGENKQEKDERYSKIRELDKQTFKAKNDIANYFRLEFENIKNECIGYTDYDLISYYKKKIKCFRGSQQNFYKLSITSNITEESLYLQIARKYSLISTTSCTSLIQSVRKDFENHLFDCLKGRRTFDSYKSGCACPVKFKILNSILNDKGYKTYHLSFNFGKNKSENLITINFSIVFPKKAFFKPNGIDKHILEFLETNNKGIIESISTTWHLHYKNKELYLICTYNQNITESEKERNIIAGIDTGMTIPITLVIKNNFRDIVEKIGSTKEFVQISMRIKNQMIKNHGVKCKSGHGKVRAIEFLTKSNLCDENFAKTKTEKYVKLAFDILVKNKTSVLKMEDLSNFQYNLNDERKKISFRFWRYGRIQELLKQKCESVGIKVIFVKAAYTSQKCSKCGHIEKENRKGEKFKCLKCNHEGHADINAAFNIMQSENIIEKNKSSLKRTKIETIDLNENQI
jgi:IS605 OrfB family transposase